MTNVINVQPNRMITGIVEIFSNLIYNSFLTRCVQFIFLSAPEGPPWWDFLSRNFPKFWEMTQAWDLKAADMLKDRGIDKYASISAFWKNMFYDPNRGPNAIDRLPFYSPLFDFRMWPLLIGCFIIFGLLYCKLKKKKKLAEEIQGWIPIFFFVFLIKSAFVLCGFAFPLFYFTFSNLWFAASATHIYVLLLELIIAPIIYYILYSDNYVVTSKETFTMKLAKLFARYEKFKKDTAKYSKKLQYFNAFMLPIFMTVCYSSFIVPVVLPLSGSLISVTGLIHPALPIAINGALTLVCFIIFKLIWPTMLLLLANDLPHYHPTDALFKIPSDLFFRYTLGVFLPYIPFLCSWLPIVGGPVSWFIIEGLKILYNGMIGILISSYVFEKKDKCLMYVMNLIARIVEKIFNFKFIYQTHITKRNGRYIDPLNPRNDSMDELLAFSFPI